MSNGYFNPVENINTSPPVSDGVKNTTCFMCSSRCGISIHQLDGNIRYIEGNKAHPVNKGTICAKGAAGIMNHFSPARLTKPLKRVGQRGKAEFQEIEWDEALSLATSWLSDIKTTDPKGLAFFTGRDQSQSFTSWWASQFGTPNYGSNGSLCASNVAAAGLYTIGGSFWESGEPDWSLSKYFVMFGVAEDMLGNSFKAGLATLKATGAKFLSVNPIKTGYSAIADEWLGIQPGTDGIFVLALIHELLKSDAIDLDYIVRYTNLPWLVIQNPGEPDNGLFARGENNEPLCWDGAKKFITDALKPDVTPALAGVQRLPDGRKVIPAFELMARRYLDTAYSPETAARATNIPADTIRRIAAELAETAFKDEIEVDQAWTDWAGRKHPTTKGRPVAIHAMRGISAHSNGFHTCRAIHLLQILLGSIDCPGGFRYKPPFPVVPPAHLKHSDEYKQSSPNGDMPGVALQSIASPQDLLIDENGAPQRIDKALSWEAPIAVHGMMQALVKNAVNHDPYPIECLFLHMTNLAWTSSMNTSEVMEMLTAQDPSTGNYRIPKIIHSDAYFSETVAYADLVLPDTTYLERWDCMSLLDQPISSPNEFADAIRQPVIEIKEDVRPFQDVLLELGTRIGLPGFTNDDGTPKYPNGYTDYLINHERSTGIGPLAGWRGAEGQEEFRGPPNPSQLDRYVENGCFWQHELPPEQRYYRFANRNYLAFAAEIGFVANPEQIILQPYCEPLQRFRLAAQGHGDIQPSDRDRNRIDTYFDPLPIWYPPFDGDTVNSVTYPFHALTQKPMAMYQSSCSQNAWLRQIHGSNPLYMNRRTGALLEIEDGDWVWIVSHHSKIKANVKFMEGVNLNTVWTWNGIGKRAGAWNLDPNSPEAKSGFLLNHIISENLPQRENDHPYANADPITGQAAWYDLRVRIEKCGDEETEICDPQFAALTPPSDLPVRPDILRFGSAFSEVDHREPSK